MKVVDERTFTPIAYLRGELVYEVEWLNGPRVAGWLATQTDDRLDGIMAEAADQIRDGEAFFYALQDAVQSAYVAAEPPACQSGRRGGAGDCVARREETV